MKPNKERRDHWPSSGPILRQQPPVRVRWCEPIPTFELDKPCKSANPDCRGQVAPCPNCQFAFCNAHLDHFSGLTVPPDAWKGLYVKLARNIEKTAKIKRVTLYVKNEDNRPMTVYQPNGVVLDARPPARIEFCDVPSTGRINGPCGHQSKTCTGATHTCDWCRFTYCERHLVFHVRRIAVPRQLWIVAVKRLEQAMDDVLRRKRKLVWVRLPHGNYLKSPEA